MAAETSTKSDSKTSSDDSQNPSSPYYLHPRENPGMVLINVQFDGGNYHAWSRGMKRALLSKNKHKFVVEAFPYLNLVRFYMKSGKDEI